MHVHRGLNSDAHIPGRPQRAGRTVEAGLAGTLRADARSVGRLTVHSERDGILHTLRLEGELDLATAEQLERELLRVEASDALSIALDLSALEFIDSTGVRLIIQADARSRADSRLALLRGPRGPQSRATRLRADRGARSPAVRRLTFAAAGRRWRASPADARWLRDGRDVALDHLAQLRGWGGADESVGLLAVLDDDE